MFWFFCPIIFLFYSFRNWCRFLKLLYVGCCYFWRLTCIFFVAVFNCVFVFLIHVYYIQRTCRVCLVFVYASLFYFNFFGDVAFHVSEVTICHVNWWFFNLLIFCNLHLFSCMWLSYKESWCFFVFDVFMRLLSRTECCSSTVAYICLQILLQLLTFWIFEIVCVTMDSLPFDSFQRNLKCTFISILRSVCTDSLNVFCSNSVLRLLLALWIRNLFVTFIQHYSFCIYCWMFVVEKDVFFIDYVVESVDGRLAEQYMAYHKISLSKVKMSRDSNQPRLSNAN